MSDALERYRDHQQRLQYVRWQNRGHESQEEDAILDEMDTVWWEIDPEERKIINGEPPRSLIRREEEPHLSLQDVDVLTNPGEPHIRERDAA